jgi:hypothetical protein
MCVFTSPLVTATRVPELPLCLSHSNSWLTPIQLLPSQEDSLQTESLYATHERYPFTTDFCPIKLPACNFSVLTTHKRNTIPYCCITRIMQKTPFLCCVEPPLPDNSCSLSYYPPHLPVVIPLLWFYLYGHSHIRHNITHKIVPPQPLKPL